MNQDIALAVSIANTAIKQFLQGSLESTCLPAHAYEAQNGRAGICEMRYLVISGKLVVFCTEIAENEGISITNAAPSPWEQAEDVIDIAYDSTIWIEHTGPQTSGRHQDHTFELLTVERSGRLNWKHLSRHSIEQAA